MLGRPNSAERRCTLLCPMLSCRWSGSSFLYVPKHDHQSKTSLIWAAGSTSPPSYCLVLLSSRISCLSNLSIKGKTERKRLVRRCRELWQGWFCIWLCWIRIEEHFIDFIDHSTPGQLEWKETGGWKRKEGDRVAVTIFLNVYGIKCLSRWFLFWAELRFYAHFSVFCSEPAGRGHWRKQVFQNWVAGGNLCRSAGRANHQMNPSFFITAC